MRLEKACGVLVAPVQVEQLQVADTPASELHASLRDSLVRFLRAAFKRRGWGDGPYWQSHVSVALAAWSTVWAGRADLAGFHQRLLDAAPPIGWVPQDADDTHLLSLLPDGREPVDG
jgi:hypothetical protein